MIETGYEIVGGDKPVSFSNIFYRHITLQEHLQCLLQPELQSQLTWTLVQVG